jgi:hypothetical protein
MAVVEMADPSSAANAWRNLVYKKLGGSVLYLEKAPVGLWNGNAAPSEPQLPIASSSVDDIPSEEGSTLFIKNLSFSTTSDTLKDTFSHLPGFVFARVQTKPDPKVAGRTLSMGFGFVGFRTAAAAVGAKRARDGLLLEGHQLEIRFAQRGKDVSKGTAARSTSATSTSTKLLVKNVPFEVTRKEIRELFRYVEWKWLGGAAWNAMLTPELLRQQRLRPAQIGPPPSQVRPEDPRIRLPRLCLAPRCRGGVCGIGAHPSPRPPSRLAVGGGGRGRLGTAALAYWLLRVHDWRENAQVCYG